MRIVIDFIYLLTAAAYSPIIVYRMVRYKRYRIGWANRFGKITRKNPSKKCIWLHAVSVGEVNAAKTIIKELENRFGSFEIVISATTDTGFARAVNLFGDRLQVFYFPLDFSLIMRHAFRQVQPTICLLMELEVWPNFIQTAHKLNIPVVVVNGRISEKSFTRYKKIKPIVKTIFRKIELILAQTERYAQRFTEIGAPSEKVVVVGSLKYDTAQITDKVEGTGTLATQLNISCHCEPEQSEGAAISNLTNEIAFRHRRTPLPRNDVIEGEKLWVAGGTGPGEEKILLDIYKNLKQSEQFGDLRLAIVPRKPERFNEVAELIKQTGFELIRYSQVKNQATGKSSIEHRASSIEFIILGDTMGDLRKFYSLATIIFVGRSLVPMGGSDMIEAAALGKCTIFGPYAFNFKQTVDALLKDNGAIEVKNATELLDTMKECLLDPDFARRIAQNGREVIKKNQGATTKTISQIAKFLNLA